jgi:SAM-dependent methyltransferase
MDDNQDFLDPVFSLKTIDVFWGRREIVKALTEQLDRFEGTVLDLGCGRMPYRSLILSYADRVQRYIGMDLRSDLRDYRYADCGPPDLEWDGKIIPLESGSVGCIIATEVLHQCGDVEVVLREAARVLQPGGILFFTVPFLWPLHCAPLDQYRYTPFSLERHLKSAGFGHITLRALGGWDSSLAQMLALWVRRKPMSRWKREILTRLATPLIMWLLKNDEPQPIFTDQTMITRIAGTANSLASSRE